MTDKPPSLAQFEDFDFRELPIGVYMTSLDGQFIVCNRTLRRMLELPLEATLNANIQDFYPEPGDRDKAMDKAVNLAKQGKNIEREVLCLRVQDRDVYVEDYCKIMQNEDGKVIGFVGCMVDITSDFESKRHERELQERIEELTFDIGRILHANTTTLVMVIQSLNSVIQAFISNPFGGYSLPSVDEIDNQLIEHADRLASAIERLTKAGDEDRRLKSLPEYKWEMLTKQIAALREFKQRVPVLESQPAALRVSAHSVGEACQNIVPGHLPRESIRDLQQAAWHLERLTTEREMVRALSNLLHNAIKYTWRRDQTKAPWVSIRARRENNKVYIEFENWGVPISKEELEQELVFKLGYRGKWSTDRGRLGTGIGLTDSRRIAETHGGGILIESHPTRHLDESHQDYFKQPFLTKVILFLPLTTKS